MKMVDDNKLKLSDKISMSSIKNTNKKHITIKEVLYTFWFTVLDTLYKNTLIVDSISGLITLNDTLYSTVKSKDILMKLPIVFSTLFLHRYNV